jgi:hypothetical protein
LADEARKTAMLIVFFALPGAFEPAVAPAGTTAAVTAAATARILLILVLPSDPRWIP